MNLLSNINLLLIVLVTLNFLVLRKVFFNFASSVRFCLFVT